MKRSRKRVRTRTTKSPTNPRQRIPTPAAQMSAPSPRIPPPCEQVFLRLDLSASNAEKLRRGIHSLFDLLQLDSAQESKTIKIPQAILEQAKEGARELLSDPAIFIAERDRATFRRNLAQLGLPCGRT